MPNAAAVGATRLSMMTATPEHLSTSASPQLPQASSPSSTGKRSRAIPVCKEGVLQAEEGAAGTFSNKRGSFGKGSSSSSASASKPAPAHRPRQEQDENHCCNGPSASSLFSSKTTPPSPSSELLLLLTRDLARLEDSKKRAVEAEDFMAAAKAKEGMDHVMTKMKTLQQQQQGQQLQAQARNGVLFAAGGGSLSLTKRVEPRQQETRRWRRQRGKLLLLCRRDRELYPPPTKGQSATLLLT